MKKTMALALAVTLGALLVMAPNAGAKGRQNDDGQRPPECQVEDGGVLDCR